MASTRPQAFISAFCSGTRTAGCASKLFGRVLRGTRPEHFNSLTHESDRLLVMLLGEDGLENLPGMTGFQILSTVLRYTDEHIRDLVGSGHQFKLAVFERDPNADVKVATWQNTIDVVASVYPLVKDKLQANLASLQSTPFQQIETAAGYNFYSAYKKGRSDPGYMTYERLQASAGSLSDVRAFLFHTIHLREPFQGNGFTGAQREYFLRDTPLSALPNCACTPIDVQLS